MKITRTLIITSALLLSACGAKVAQTEPAVALPVQPTYETTTTQPERTNRNDGSISVGEYDQINAFLEHEGVVYPLSASETDEFASALCELAEAVGYDLLVFNDLVMKDRGSVPEDVVRNIVVILMKYSCDDDLNYMIDAA